MSKAKITVTISSPELQCDLCPCVSSFSIKCYMLFLIELEKPSYETNAQCVLDIQAIKVQFSCSCHQLSASVNYDRLLNLCKAREF